MSSDNVKRARETNEPSSIDSDKKWIRVCILAVIGLFLLVLLASQLSEQYSFHTTRVRYPLIFRESGENRYHTIADIERKIRNDNFLNPFYCEHSISHQTSKTTTKDVAWDHSTADEESTRRNKKDEQDQSQQYLRTISAFGPCSDTERTLRVLIVCGQHGRERITTEVCYHLVRLLQLQEQDPLFTPLLQRLSLRGVGLWLVPAMNTQIFEQMDEYPEYACLRKNIRGVDLNRNFDSPSWCRKRVERADENSVEFGGHAAHSEVETLALIGLMDRVQPHLLLNIHSGARSILLPYDCSVSRMPEHYSLMVRIANSIRKHVCTDCTVGSSALTLYESAGTLMDYALEFAGIPLAYTLEVYSDEKAEKKLRHKNEMQLNADECKRLFNPSEGTVYEETVWEAIRLILSLVERVQYHAKNIN